MNDDEYGDNYPHTPDDWSTDPESWWLTSWPVVVALGVCLVGLTAAAFAIQVGRWMP